MLLCAACNSFTCAQVSTVEWLLLLRGAGLVSNPKKNPMSDYCAEPGWNFLWALESQLPDSFTGIIEHVTSNTSSWAEWVQASEPQQL